MEFLGLGLENNIPDRTTFWLFKQELLKQELITELFKKLESYLQKSGYEAKGGQIVDATIGIKRVSLNIGLKNLTYNFQRLVFWSVKKA